jgi:hypothetical protein
MRYAFAVLLACAALHCGVSTEPVEGTPAPVAAAEAPAPPRSSAPPAPTTLWSEETPAEALGPPVASLASLVRASDALKVSSVVRAPSGDTFVTGTFIGAVQVGASTLTSKGAEDVFLVRLDASARLVWVRAVGGPGVERAPRVSLENASVTLFGMTNGEMDCGHGPLQRWSSETFFLCDFDVADGTPGWGGVFPTGVP